MIQLVWTGAQVTVAQRLKVLELMQAPLKIEAPTQCSSGHKMAEEMLALLRDRLTPRERVQLIDMRNQTASTINEASELQSGTITRPERRPMEL